MQTMMKKMCLKTLPLIGLVLALALVTAGGAQAMTRTLKKEPAVVIVAFGTTTKARATYDFFDAQLRRELPEPYRHGRIAWAFSSEIVRERANAKFKKEGKPERFLSLAQVLANLEDEGYRKVAVQPLVIFPGQEFEEIERAVAAFRTMGMRIELGGTLMHKWEWAFEAVAALEKEFLPPGKGVNVLVAHGTPETFPGSNAAYLGLDRYLSRKYPNVVVGTVEGLLTREQALAVVKNSPTKRARLIPFMYVAGDHIMNDIMGREPEKDGSLSWALELERAGVKVDSVPFDYQGDHFYKGLGFYEAINHQFIEQLAASLKRLAEN